jgi:hypothetical protein
VPPCEVERVGAIGVGDLEVEPQCYVVRLHIAELMAGESGVVPLREDIARVVPPKRVIPLYFPTMQPAQMA